MGVFNVENAAFEAHKTAQYDFVCEGQSTKNIMHTFLDEKRDFL